MRTGHAQQRSRYLQARHRSHFEASAAWLGAPIPASTTTGTAACLMMISIWARVSSPRLLPMGRSQRHDRRRADILKPFGQHRIRVDVGQNSEAFLDKNFRGLQRFDRIGQQIVRVGMISSFTQRGSPAAAARRARRTASLASNAPLVLGRRRYLFGSMKSRCSRTDHAFR